MLLHACFFYLSVILLGGARSLQSDKNFFKESQIPICLKLSGSATFVTKLQNNRTEIFSSVAFLREREEKQKDILTAKKYFHNEMNARCQQKLKLHA